YRWLVEPDFEFGIPIIDHDLIEAIAEPDEEHEVERDPESVKPLEDIAIEDLPEILDLLEYRAEDRNQWWETLASVHHQFGDKAWSYVDEWSKRRGNYNKRTN